MSSILTVFIFAFAILNVLTVPATAQNIAALGWPPTLEPLFTKLQETKDKNYVVLISRIPTLVLDSRTENGYRDSVTQRNFARDFHPGHVMIGWKCNLGPQQYNSFLGFNGDELEVDGVTRQSLRDLAVGGFGINTLLARFTDGFIETPENLEEFFQGVIEKYEQKSLDRKQFIFIGTALEISHADCSGIINKINSFHSNHHAKTSFGLGLDPEKEDGAACNSFAMSMLKETKVGSTLVGLFNRQLRFPSYLLGYPKLPPVNVKIDDHYQNLARGRKVSQLKLMVSDWSPSSVDPNVEFNFTDSELILLWQKQFLFSEINFWPKSISFSVDWKKAFNRRFWERDVNPYEDFQRGYKLSRVDKNYDPQSSQIAAEAKTLIENSKISYLSIMGFPFTVVENLQ
jgi:hypothetical protein